MNDCNWKAFTLVEILAVLVLMALLSTVVGLSLKARKDYANQNQVVDRILTFEEQARRSAEQAGASRSMEFDLIHQQILLFDESAQRQVAESLELPEDYALAQVQFADHRVTAGSVAVTISPRGSSPSYALEITGPEHWQKQFFFVGLTGQAVEFHDEKQLQNIWAISLPARDDAH